MFIFNIFFIFSVITGFFSPDEKKETTPFDWKNATVYFMLTDRFYNGDPTNDVNFNRINQTHETRRFMGGDIKGITKKIEEGYFNKLGVDAIWFSPVNEQIHGSVNEGQGETYAFHGYWIRDWSSMEPNFGNEADLPELMRVAHAHGIRILLDVIINHTGPVTDTDPVWPADWVRTEPQCNYQNYNSTVFCTLVKNLPDVRTEQTQSVELPQSLLDKWASENRLDKELSELDAFFARTGYPRTPRYYIIKWITDYIRKFGIDGFRVDTVKHTEADVWADLAKEAQIAFDEWKAKNPEPIQQNQDFFMVAETYNFGALNGRLFDFGDKKVDYFAAGFDSQINFGFKGDAHKSYEEIFSSYSQILNEGELQGVTFMNYISSHDDGWPFDTARKRTFESATKLLLAPGQAQIYYGDEIARPLTVEGAQGDANLRGFMPWNDPTHQDLLLHWQKLGQFRQNHLSIGAGAHEMVSAKPYVFGRTYQKNNVEDRVIVALDLPKGETEITVAEYFADGLEIFDAYSGKLYKVAQGKVKVKTDAGIVLLERMN